VPRSLTIISLTITSLTITSLTITSLTITSLTITSLTITSRYGYAAACNWSTLQTHRHPVLLVGIEAQLAGPRRERNVAASVDQHAIALDGRDEVLAQVVAYVCVSKRTPACGEPNDEYACSSSTKTTRSTSLCSSATPRATEP
jgi:hypothetical protein